MLVDPKFLPELQEVDPIVCEILGPNWEPPKRYRLTEGVYDTGSHNSQYDLDRAQGWVIDYTRMCPELKDTDGQYFPSYGVCDCYTQILEQCPTLQDPDREFVVMLCEVRRAEQPASGGWRWHKWGAYIGTHDIQCEYLYDEVGIDSVFCFHIYERKTDNGKV